MSIKATAVSTVFAPKTQKGYLIIVPKIFHTVLLASRADYPKTQLNRTKVSVFGNDYTIPLRGKTDNTFTITIPEGSFSEIEFEIDELLAQQANYGYRKGNNLSTFNIFVCPFMGTPPNILGDALDSLVEGLEGVSDTLQAITEFIGSALLSDALPLPTEWKTLKGCTLLDYKPDGFNSAGRDSVMNWNLTFQYTMVSPLVKSPVIGHNLTKKVKGASDGNPLEVGKGTSKVSMWNGPLFTKELN